MLRTVVITSGFQLASLTVQLVDRFIVTALMLRAWGVSTFEAWSLLFAAAGLFNLLDLGLYQTLSNAYTQAYQSGEKVRFKRLMSLGLGLNIATGLCGLSILSALLFWGCVPSAVGAYGIEAYNALAIFTCFALTTILQTTTACMLVTYRAQARFARGLRMETFLTALRTLVVAGAVALGAAPLGAAVLHAAVSFFVLLLVVPLDLRRSLDSLSFSARAPRAEDWSMLRQAAPYFYAQHATTLLLVQLPTVVLGALASSVGAVAAFLFLRMLLNFARTLMQLLANSISVEIARLYIADANHYPTRQTASICRFMCALTGAVVGGLLPVSDALVRIWSGGMITAPMPIAIALSLGLLLTGPFILTAAILNLTGHEKLGAASKLVNALVALTLSFVLVPRLDATGVAVALACGEVIGLGLVLLPQSARLVGASPLRIAMSWLFWSGLSASLVLAVVSTLLAVLQPNGILQLALVGLIAVPPVALIVAVAGISKSGRRALFERLNALPGLKAKQ